MLIGKKAGSVFVFPCFIKKKDLKKKVTIRGEKLTVVDAINRQLAHYPYHIGQIIYIAKAIKNVSWNNLSVPKGGSTDYNKSDGIKDPAKTFLEAVA